MNYEPKKEREKKRSSCKQSRLKKSWSDAKWTHKQLYNPDWASVNSLYNFLSDIHLFRTIGQRSHQHANVNLIDFIYYKKNTLVSTYKPNVIDWPSQEIQM